MTWTRTPLIWGESHVSAETHAPSRFNLPAGTVTCLLSDVEGSTRLWSQFPDAMAAAVADTYAVLDRAVARCARLRSIAAGGQTVLSRATRDLVVDRLPDGAELVVSHIFAKLGVGSRAELAAEATRRAGPAR